MNFEMAVKEWKNEDKYNDDFHAACTVMVNATPRLREHRDWVEQHQHGFGDRAFHWIWHLLVGQMPETFRFLEVGVFKGQVLSLINLLTKIERRNADIYGVTTLANTEDTRCKYPEGDYIEWIKEIHKAFDLCLIPLHLIVGRSSEPHVVEQARMRDYHIVYLDGGHDAPDVRQDIINYGPMVKVGGFLVVDDASIGRLRVGGCWPGLEDVAQAVADLIDKNPHYKFLFACGHLNVFQKLP